jgi:hypothetical protein
MALQTSNLTMVGLGSAKDTPPNSEQPPLIDGIHLRWAFKRELGFPWHGFYLFRRVHDPGTLSWLSQHIGKLPKGPQASNSSRHAARPRLQRSESRSDGRLPAPRSRRARPRQSQCARRRVSRCGTRQTHRNAASAFVRVPAIHRRKNDVLVSQTRYRRHRQSTGTTRHPFPRSRDDDSKLRPKNVIRSIQTQQKRSPASAASSVCTSFFRNPRLSSKSC